MENPVVTFLTTRNGYTFDEGVAVFAMYMRDRNAVERVRKSHDIRLLQHELKQLAHVPGLKPVNGIAMPVVPQQPDTVPEQPDDVLNQGQNVPKEPDIKTELTIHSVTVVNDSKEQSGTNETVTYEDLQHHKYTRYEDMPTPETQALWQRNNDRWHRKIDLFAKMKLLPEGKELAAVRNELVEVSREHREAWKLIDEKCEEFYANKDSESQKVKPAEQPFNVSTYRAYISKMLDREQLSDKQFITLQQRVTEMLNAHIEFENETLEKLRAKGISC